MIETTPKVNINTKNEYGKTAEDYASSKKMRARLKKAELQAAKRAVKRNVTTQLLNNQIQH